MLSDNITRAKKIIQTYPEVFESLLEFERTKKIPKLYKRKRLNITLDENIVRQAKKYCVDKNMNLSRFIERTIVEEMGKV